MNYQSRIDELPLKEKTPVRWAVEVLKHPVELLNDHGHLEKKAAANALALIQRWPEGAAPPEWIAEMTSIAKDEVLHLALVTELLEKRGAHLSKSHRNPYARALRDIIRNGQGAGEMIDRLMVCALLEARSCERFALLAEVAEDRELKKLYSGLWSSEMGHYKGFLGLAQGFFPEEDIAGRWEEVLELESEILRSQEFWPGMHSWLP